MTDYTQLTGEDLWMRLQHESGRDRVEVLAELGERAFQAREFGQARTLLEEAVGTAESVGWQIALVGTGSPGSRYHCSG